MERKKNPIVDQIKEESQKNDKEQEQHLLLIPTGSTLLNLACSDTADGGWGVGKMVNLIGDSSSGKSLLSFTMFAEIVRRREFDEYSLIYDDVEQACEFNVEKLFGKKVANRVEPPGMEDGEPKHSDVIQDFYGTILQLCKTGKPFIYVLDSLDALSSKEEVAKVDDVMKAHKEGKETSGSYGMDKPKSLTQMFRVIISKLKATKSFLLIISQTRDNINPMSYEKKTRSGGNALRFYASHEIWLTMAKKHESKDRIIGAKVIAKIRKNKITGKLREVTFSIYYDLGLDNIGSCADFLIEENVWKKSKLTIEAEDLGLKGTRESLIRQIEHAGLEDGLAKETEKAWIDIEESLKLNRKPRYSE